MDIFIDVMGEASLPLAVAIVAAIAAEIIERRKKLETERRVKRLQARAARRAAR